MKIFSKSSLYIFFLSQFYTKYNKFVMPQILGNLELDSWAHVKGLTLNITPIHARSSRFDPKILGSLELDLIFFSFLIKHLILNKFIKLRFIVTYYFIFPKPTTTLFVVHKYKKNSTNHLPTQKLKYLQ